MNIKNKRGFFGLGGITAGVAGILAGTIILLVILALVFLTFNKFAVIGAGLIALTLIFGFKGEFNREKSIFMAMIVIVGLAFILGGNVLQTQFGPAHVYMDKELGMVTGTFENSYEQAYFKTISGNSVTVSTVGEKVKICDIIVDLGSNYEFKKYDWITGKNGNTISTVSILGWADRNKGSIYCREWTPTSAGKYDVGSYYEYCPATNGFICVDSYKAMKDGNSWYCPNYGDLTIDGTQICDNNKCSVSSGSCGSYDSRDVKRYYLTVNTIENECNKDAYVGSWYVDSIIDGGQILKQNVYKVTDDCRYVVNYEIVQTQCDDNYVIEGTNLRATSNDGWNCVSTITDEDYIDEDGNGVEDDYEEREDECNTDLIVECGDGTEIVEKLCVDNLYFDSGATCSVIGNDGNEDNNRDDDNDGITNDQDTDDDNDGILDNVDPDDDNNGIPDVEEIETESFMDQYGMFVVGGSIILILAILLFAWSKRK